MVDLKKFMKNTRIRAMIIIVTISSMVRLTTRTALMNMPMATINRWIIPMTVAVGTASIMPMGIIKTNTRALAMMACHIQAFNGDSPPAGRLCETEKIYLFDVRNCFTLSSHYAAKSIDQGDGLCRFPVRRSAGHAARAPVREPPDLLCGPGL